MRLPDDAPIAAIATAPGRGGIGVVRVSGKDLGSVLAALLGQARAEAIVPRQASFGPFLDAAGGEIDRGIAIRFPAPHSYTGEEVIELQGHGGPVVIYGIVFAVLAPLGQLAASAVLPDADEIASGLRRFDSILLGGPVWAAMLAAGVGV